MSDSSRRDDLPERVERYQRRREEWERDGERSLAENLAMIGSLGWLIVAPTLLGVLAGRWLDREYGTGIFWSGALLFVGLTFGCWSAWRRVHHG